MFWTTPLALMFWSIGVTATLAQANDHKGMNDNSLWIGTPTLERRVAEYQALGVRWFRLELDWKRHPAEWARHIRARMA